MYILVLFSPKKSQNFVLDKCYYFMSRQVHLLVKQDNSTDEYDL